MMGWLGCLWCGGWLQAATGDNTSGIDCKWLLIGACAPMAAVIIALWRALEAANKGRMEDLRSSYKSVNEEHKKEGS